jgi:hypothetical protein
VARCGIYHQRPAACRAFPTKLNETGELAIIHPVPERGRGGTDPAYELCPREWEPADLDPIGTVQDLVVAKYEMQFFSQLSKIWNRAPRDWELFPEFLHAVYAGRVLADPAAEVDDADEPLVSIKMPHVHSDAAGRRAA